MPGRMGAWLLSMEWPPPPLVHLGVENGVDDGDVFDGGAPCHLLRGVVDFYFEIYAGGVVE